MNDAKASAGLDIFPALGRQRQVDLCELKANLVNITSSGQSGLQSETLSWKEMQRQLLYLKLTFTPSMVDNSWQLDLEFDAQLAGS